MNDEPHSSGNERGTDLDRTSDSAPWERPRRWSQQSLESSKVDELLAKLGDDPTSRRQRRGSDGDQVPASELIAALQHPDNEATVVAGPAAIDPSTDDATQVIVPVAADPGSPAGLIGQAPIQDLESDESRTDVIPKVGATAAAAGEVRSIRAALRAQSTPDVPGPAAATRAPATGGQTTVLLPTAMTDRANGAGGGGGEPPPPTGRMRHAPGAPPHRHRGWLYAGRALVVTLVVLLVGGMGWEWTIKRRADQAIERNQVVALNPTDSNIVAPGKVVTTGSDGATVTLTTVAPAKTYAPQNILLLGSDTRADGNGNATNSNGDQNSSQSDTLMIAHISGDRQHVTVLSIPRDTMIPAPTCKSWDYTTGKVSNEDVPISEGQRFHINNAYAVGGPRCTVTAIQALTGLKIDRLIGIDFNGFKAMVDALGGITVNACRPIVDAEINTVIPSAGVQKIAGEQALNLVRARNVYGDTDSDLARIRRQQLVLSTILRQVNSAGVLLSPPKLDRFLQAFAKNTFTENVTLDDLAGLASSLGDFDPKRVTFYTLPTVPSEITPDALEVDESKAPAVFSALINDRALPGETTAASKPSTTRSTGSKASASTSARSTPTTRSSAATKITVAPRDVDLEIYNVAGTEGVAGTVRDLLQAEGFVAGDDRLVRDDDNVQKKVTVRYSAGNEEAAITVAAAVPGSVLEETDDLGSTVRLMVGSDFSGTVSSVAVGDPVPTSLSVPSAVATADETSNSSTSTSATSSRSKPTTSLKPTDLTSVNAGQSQCV